MSYETNLFDLDGTLCDPRLSIVESVHHALSRVGINEPNLDELRRFVGPPLGPAFQEHYDLDEATADEAVVHYRERFEAEGIKQYTVYDGIIDLLQRLVDGRRVLGVVTSKPEKYARMVLTHTGLTDYFDVIGAPQPDNVVEKRVTMAQVLGPITTAQAAKTVMVGDRRYDIEAAHPFGIDSIGVLYGFGTRQELAKCGPTYIAEDVEGLTHLLTR